MFKDVPAQVWLLLAIFALAYAPALYAYRYINDSPAGRDITLAPKDLSWRNSGQFARCLTLLVVLSALAVFIWTPAAVQFAHSPAFLQLLMAALGAVAIYTVLRGISSGKIEPLVRGVYKEYDRETQPKRYWASLTWNSLLGVSFLWFAYDAIGR